MICMCPRLCRELVADFVATSRHVEMVCLRDFRHLCPRLSRGEVSVKVGVMKFGLYKAREIIAVWHLIVTPTSKMLIKTTTPTSHSTMKQMHLRLFQAGRDLPVFYLRNHKTK